MFDTLAACSDTCLRPHSRGRLDAGLDLYVADPCQQEQEEGPCRAAMPRWFFNKHTQTCQEVLNGRLFGRHDLSLELAKDGVREAGKDSLVQSRQLRLASS